MSPPNCIIIPLRVKTVTKVVDPTTTPSHSSTLSDFDCYILSFIDVKHRCIGINKWSQFSQRLYQELWRFFSFFCSSPPFHDTFTFIICVYALVWLEKLVSLMKLSPLTMLGAPSSLRYPTTYYSLPQCYQWLYSWICTNTTHPLILFKTCRCTTLYSDLLTTISMW